MSGENSAKSLRDLREDGIVYVAAELFLQNGIESVKMTDVAEKAEVGVASLYRYFGTKDKLVIRAGALLWRDLDTLVSDVYEAADYLSCTGMERVSRLFGVYLRLFREQPAFIRFVGEFDSFARATRAERETMAEYEASVLNFYPVFLKAYEAGVRDGTIRPIEDARLFYDSVCHAVMALAQKLLQGEILEADGFGDERELRLLLDMAEGYLRTLPPQEAAEPGRCEKAHQIGTEGCGQNAPVVLHARGGKVDGEDVKARLA